MATLSMSSPWIIRYRQIEAMFKLDPEVHVIYDEDKNVVKLYVENADKASALDYLLVKCHAYGIVKLAVIVVPPNNENLIDVSGWLLCDIIDTAFRNNGAYSFCHTLEGIFNNNMTYVVFRKQVVQYYTDNLSDFFGQCSTLYQNIATDIFEHYDGVYYCTDVEDPVVLDATNEIMWP